MPFAIQCGTDGQPICKCCRDMLWHCRRCWAEHHNCYRDCSDYEPPKYYGQSMIPKSISKELKKMGERFIHNPTIKPNKDRKYEEGDYHH